MSPNRQILYKQESLPVFQNRMYESAASARSCLTGDVILIQDEDTGLVRNEAFRPELVVYDKAYQNEQGISQSFQLHLLEVLGIIERSMGKMGIVEVGCGKGLFLELMLDHGFDATGFDPAYEGSNPRVLRQIFEPNVGIHSKGMVLRHVLEHIPNPVQFLQQLGVANGDEGLIYIEVPCLDWICEHRTWFDVFYEHVNYFRLSDFHRIFENVLESGRVFGSQYLYVVADLASIRNPKITEEQTFHFPINFTKSIDAPDPFWTPNAAVWGGASKGVIFSLFKERQGQPIKTVIDINPAKQGKYLPLTGLKVQSPSEVLPALPANSVIYVMNSNYLEEIKTLSNNKYHYITIDHE